MKIFLVIISSLMLVAQAHAYRVGDVVEKEVMGALSIDPEKLTLVDFFASWCTSCKKELPLINNMTFDAKRVEVVGVCTDEELSKGVAFQKKLGLKFRIVNDTKQTIVSKFSPFGMPALYYVLGGKVVKVRQGALPSIDKKIRKDVSNILAKQ